MAKNNSHNDLRRINLQSIINRLPIKRHLNESQNSLIKFSMTWQDWVKSNLPIEIQTHAILSSFKNGTLSILCSNSIVASQLKHLQASLLEAFINNGYNEINRLKFEIDRDLNSNQEKVSASIKNSSSPLKQKPRASLSYDALNTLKHCEKGVKDEKLSESLKKLHQTLSNMDKPS